MGKMMVYRIYTLWFIQPFADNSPFIDYKHDDSLLKNGEFQFATSKEDTILRTFFLR